MLMPNPKWQSSCTRHFHITFPGGLFVLWFRFDWSLFLLILLKTVQHCLRQWLGAEKSTSYVVVRIKSKVYCGTTHMLSIERADWPRLHDMFKARDAKAWQGEFPVGFPIRVCALHLLLIDIFLDSVAGIDSRCVIKGKHVLLFCLICSVFYWKNCTRVEGLV